MTLEAWIVAAVAVAAVPQEAPEPVSAVGAAEETSAPAPEPAPAVAASPGDARAAINSGLRAYWRLNFAAAEAEFRRAHELDPQSAPAAFYLGYSIYKQYEFRRFHPEKQRAKEMFARAFELDPGFVPDFKQR
jgi:tetratricopeptide (TPR) repeat protein